VQTREISAIAYASLQIAHLAGSVVASSLLKLSMVGYLQWLDAACWLAFAVFSAAAFEQFPRRWLRVIAAVAAFYFLPAGLLLLPYLKLTYLIPPDWRLASLSIVVASEQLMKLAIAGLIYVWSVGREGALSTRPAA
jgi:hypothetical protein